MVGRTSSPKTTIADTGFPGRPKAGLPSITPTMVGLPGFSEMPCTSTPGLPRLSITDAVMSRLLTELPAEKTSMSPCSSARTAASRWAS